MIDRHMAFSGDLGGGKSVVATRLAETHDRRYVSIGDVHRTLAASMKLSTLETNLLAETDESIDRKVDGVTRELGDSPDPIVFDGRLAWMVIPSSFKVYLLVDAHIAAARLHSNRFSPVEGYESAEDARAGADERFQSERRRFLSKYQVDTTRLRNYNLVIDTSHASIDEVVAAVETSAVEGAPELQVKVSPQRILPGFDLTERIDPAALTAFGEQPVVLYARPFFVALTGQDVLSDALNQGKTLMNVQLLAENTEEVADGMTAEDFVQAVSPDAVREWEQRHNFEFLNHPDLARN